MHRRLNGSSSSSTTGFRVAPRFGLGFSAATDVAARRLQAQASTDGVGGQMSTQTSGLTPGGSPSVPAPRSASRPSVPAPRSASRRRTLYRGDPGMWSWVLHRISGATIFFFLFVHVLDTALVRVSPQ